MDTWDADLAGVVALPDGRSVRGRALRGGRPEGDARPGFGLYCTSRPHIEPGWESRWVCWPDFRLPRSSHEAVDALREAYERSADEKVEIACGGGAGRTGTAIAILARFAGVPAVEAVEWARANYSPRAVETPWQRRYVQRVDLTS
ncbi:MAG: protein-tyrosine phosphatase family protein [Herbiconiux sp.]|nr:protein-tyrosine phosphatase family protein [Herbiconiux sp.]